MPEQALAEGLQPVERTHDGATERSCYRLTATPIIHFALCCLGYGGTGKFGVQSVKLSLRKESNRKGMCCFNLLLFLGDLIYFNWQ